MNNDLNNQQNQNRQIVINAQYIKDLSFESPNAPFSLTSNKEQPEVALNLDIAAKKLQDDAYEIILEIKATIKADGKDVFLIDLKYGALFTLINIPEEHLETILYVHCPTITFPFARRVIADVTRDGGFQPLMIDPIDFLAFNNNKKAQLETQPVTTH